VLHSAYVVDQAAQRAKPFHPVMADGTSAFSDANDPLSEICAEVGPTDREPVLVKSEASAFAGGGLADRLAALDGRLEVHSPPGGGTTVRAEVPCA
jgi:maleamate amidohydrolase